MPPYQPGPIVNCMSFRLPLCDAMETEQEQINLYFTRAVVGKPVRMNLGVATRPPNGLRWGPVGKNAKKGWRLSIAWPIPGSARIKSMLSSRASKLTALGGGLALASLYALVGLGVIGNSSPDKQETVGGVQQDPTPVQLSSIRIEKAEFPQELGPASQEPLPARAADRPLPMFAPPGETAGTPYQLKPSNPQPTIAAAVTKPAKEDAAPEKSKPVSAVILDAVPDRAKPAQEPPAGEPKKAGKKSDTGIKQSEPATVRQTTATPTASGPAVTIVDIDRNGSYVLLTNPVTRLPEKFVAGQKIFTGETITKIDPANGRIQLGSRTVNIN